jgi:hypothetical protein
LRGFGILLVVFDLELSGASRRSSSTGGARRGGPWRRTCASRSRLFERPSAAGWRRISDAEKRWSSADVEAAREALLADELFRERAERLLDEERAKGHQRLWPAAHFPLGIEYTEWLCVRSGAGSWSGSHSGEGGGGRQDAVGEGGRGVWGMGRDGRVVGRGSCHPMRGAGTKAN